MHLAAFALASTNHLGSRCCEAQAPQPGRTEGASRGGSSASASAALVASNSAATSSPANARAISSLCVKAPPPALTGVRGHAHQATRA